MLLPHCAPAALLSNITLTLLSPYFFSPAGSAVFSVAKVDPATGEIAGVFESIQPSDTDLGAKAPKDVKITGLWYAQLK
jgi:hypothetical protein